MYVLIVLVKENEDRWVVKKLPVIEQRRYEPLECYQKIEGYINNQINQVWFINQSIPLVKASYVRDKQVFLSTKQVKRWMNRASSKWSIGWYKLLDKNIKLKKSDDIDAVTFWNSIKHRLEGKLLHIYELQRSITYMDNRINITLDQLYDYLFVWSWLDLIEVYSGIYQKPAPFTFKKRLECRRCLNTDIKKWQVHCYSCGSECYYCEQCLQLGKVKSCSLLISNRQQDQKANLAKPTIHSIAHYIQPYHLSDAQEDAVKQLLESIIEYYQLSRRVRKLRKKDKPLQYLIWAVTGAGKTEMIFPLIALFLSMKKTVLIAIPRRDVVQELQPRIAKAFPTYKVISLYGGSRQVWDFGQIYVTTTHQLVRFSSYFDLVILDEMDAFPYYNNKMLSRTLKRVQKDKSCFVQLTATLPYKERLQVRFRQLNYIKVPVRYHRHPLPIPEFVKTASLFSILQAHAIPPTLKHIIEQSHQRGAVLFIFLQRKVYLQPFAQLLKQNFSYLAISYTFAEDVDREVKVKQFRERKIDILITTSILERGVTIKKSDICIMDAHQLAYTRTAIVQMAGRAGRSIEDPKGFVYLLGLEKTAEIKGAIKDIKHMNELARSKGYFKS